MPVQQNLSIQSLSTILEHTEEYLKPITPLFTFPDTRYECVIPSEGCGGCGRAAIFPAVTRVFLRSQARPAGYS